MKIGTRGFCALLCILCLLLVGGCGASAKTGDVFFTDLNQADRIIISVEPQANPKVKSPAKICTRESDLAALKEHLSDKTMIIVAQRISTVIHAEQIIVLNEGRIVGIGTHEELMKSCDVYREIAYSQLSKEELDHE